MKAHIIEFANYYGENQYMALVSGDDLFTEEQWTRLKSGETIPYIEQDDGAVLTTASIVNEMTVWRKTNEATVVKGRKVV